MKIIFIDIPKSLDLMIKILSKVGLKIYILNLVVVKSCTLKELIALGNLILNQFQYQILKKLNT